MTIEQWTQTAMRILRDFPLTRDNYDDLVKVYMIQNYEHVIASTLSPKDMLQLRTGEPLNTFNIINDSDVAALKEAALYLQSEGFFMPSCKQIAEQNGLPQNIIDTYYAQ